MAVDLSELEQHFNLPPGLLAAVQQTESGSNPNAVSPAGALGAFQFMPATAQQYGIDPLNPDQAAQGAAHMYGDLLQKYNGDLPSALAAYNWGQGNVDRKGLQNAPPETQGYISKVMGAIGNAIIPSAQAAEMPQQQNPYDNMSNEQLLAEAKKQGLQPSSLEKSIGATSQLPNEEVEKAPLTPSVEDEVKSDIASEGKPDVTNNPYDNLSNEALLDEAKKQGLEVKLPSGTSAYGGEVSKAFDAGKKLADQGAFPLRVMADYLKNGQISPETAKDMPDSLMSALGPVSSALGAVSMVTSPLEGANRAFIANPLENKTGIPAGLTDFALNLIEPTMLGKGVSALSRFAPAAEIAEDNSALSKMTGNYNSGPGPGYIAPEQSIKNDNQATSALSERPYNITNAQDIQAKPSDTIVDFADKQPSYTAGTGPDYAPPMPAPPPDANPVNPWTGKPISQPVPVTSATQRALATQAFKEADAKGGHMSADFSNDVMHGFGEDLTESPRVTAALGKNPAQKMAADLSEEFANKPMSLDDATSIYKRLGDAMDGDVDRLTGKLGAQGQQFFAMQTRLRNAMDSAAKNGQILGGSEGVQAWQRGNALWAQSARLADIERIIQRAEGAANETLVRQNGFRALANNPARLRGYTKDEIAAIKAAAKTGTATNLLRVFGSRLLPIGATIVGESMGGPLGAIVGGGVSHAISTGARSGMDALEAGKHQNVLNTIGKRKIP